MMINEQYYDLNLHVRISDKIIKNLELAYLKITLEFSTEKIQQEWEKKRTKINDLWYNFV